MDPWYFLDISLEDNEDDLDINEFADYSPGGDWIIQCDDYKIIYENNIYDVVKYNNTTKQITFWRDGEELFNLQIIVKNEDKSDKNKINVIENIVDIIDDNKEKITDMNYIKIMEFLQKEYISN
jgi:hypothetical protein